MTRIVVAEDDILLGELVRSLLHRGSGLKIVAGTTTGAETVAVVKRERPDVLLLDVNLPDGSGWDVLEELRRDGGEVRTVLMSVDYGREALRRARSLGAAEYVDKRHAAGSLAAILRRVAAGESWFQDHAAALRSQAEVASAAMGGLGGASRPLTEREQEVARRVCEGMSNGQIAEALAISKSTVTAHIGNILVKLDAQNRTDLARIVVERGLLRRKR